MHLTIYVMSWLYSMIQYNQSNPPNYTIYRCDGGSRGSGVLIAVSGTIPFKFVLSCYSIEMIIAEVFITPLLLVCCIYILPAFPESYFKKILHSLNQSPTIEMSSLPEIFIHWTSTGPHFQLIFLSPLFSVTLYSCITFASYY